MTTVYVAGSTSDVDRVREVQALCRARGWTVAFDWTGPDGEIRTDGSWDANSVAGARIAQTEIRACVEAELVILLSPSTGRGLGCWIEMGAALATGAAVLVVAPTRDSVFWQHPNVSRFDSFADLCGFLGGQEATG